MKRLISILVVVLMVASEAHVFVARHFCGGVPVAARVSFTGELASCGMAESDNNCPIHKDSLDRHCCDDKVSVYGIDNTCVSTAYSAPEQAHIRSLMPPVVAGAILNDLFFPVSEYADTGPPSSVSLPAVDLPVICQFRL